MNLKEPIVILGPIFLVAALILSVVTRPSPVHTLSIKEVITVCHNDFKVWAVKYGTNGWMIIPHPALSSTLKEVTIMYGERCDGTEEEHPNIEKEEEKEYNRSEP